MALLSASCLREAPDGPRLPITTGSPEPLALSFCQASPVFPGIWSLTKHDLQPYVLLASQAPASPHLLPLSPLPTKTLLAPHLPCRRPTFPEAGVPVGTGTNCSLLSHKLLFFPLTHLSRLPRGTPSDMSPDIPTLLFCPPPFNMTHTMHSPTLESKPGQPSETVERPVVARVQGRAKKDE